MPGQNEIASFRPLYPSGDAPPIALLTSRAQGRWRRSHALQRLRGVNVLLRPQHVAQTALEVFPCNGLLQNRRIGETAVKTFPAIAGDKGKRHVALGQHLRDRIDRFASKIEIEDRAIERRAGRRQSLIRRAAWTYDEQSIFEEEFAHHHADNGVVLGQQNPFHRSGRQLHESLVGSRVRTIGGGVGADGNLQRAVQPGRAPIPRDISAELMLDAGVHDLGAEPLRRRLTDRRAAGFFPVQIHHPAARLPADVHRSVGDGKRAVFRRVRRQFVQRQRKILRFLRWQENRRARNLHPGIVCSAIRRHLLAHQPFDMRASTQESYIAAVEGRIHALAQAHTLLSETRWQGAHIERLIGEEMAPYRGANNSRVKLSGPAVFLPPEKAQNLALALHELATNSAKYGALSVAKGVVEVNWKVQSGMVHLHWQESGGPPVSQPSAQGFGTKIMNASIRHQLGGNVAWDWSTSGLRC